MVSTQVIIEFVRRSPLESHALDELADACIEALNRDARFVAFGPVVSVDYSRNALEVECTVCAEEEDQVDGIIDRIGEIVHGALAATDYATSAERILISA